MEAPPSLGGPAPGGYADSVDSLSPRSRGGDSWDEPFAPSSGTQPAAANSSKLRLMCSYGGHIVPRPHDKALCYLGGETRIVAVDRHSSLADLHDRLSRSLLGGRPFSLKYQLPSEDLDSLISVATDEDFENMIEEYDRVAAASSHSSALSPGGGGGSGSGSGGGKPSRLRLFLFPAKPEPDGLSSSSISSLLDDSTKSETWFVDALNGAVLGRNHSSADSAASSVNCLLGLDDSYPQPDAGGGGMRPGSDAGFLFPRQDSSGKLGGGGRQDVQSMPDSPMLETASSFGSASSAPFLSSLPPIRVRPDDLRGIDAAGLDEQFSLLNISGQQKQQHQQPPLDVDGYKQHLHPLPPPPLENINLKPLAATVATATGETPTNVSPTENPKPSTGVIPSDDDKSHHGGFGISPPQKLQQQPHQELQPQEQQQLQQEVLLENSNVLDVPISANAVSRPAAYCQERPMPPADPKQLETPASDAGYRFPVHVTEQGYLLHQPSAPLPHMRAVEQPQLHQQLQQQTQHQQNAIPHLAAPHLATGVLPIASYYNQMLIHPQQQLPQVAAQHPYSSQVPMYFLPIHHGSAYNLHVQPKFGDAVATAPISSTSKPTISTPNSVLPPQVAPPHKQELPANIYQTGVGATPALSQPPLPTKLIHLGQSHQYMGYQPLHLPASQSAAAAAMPVATGYGYEYTDAVRPYQIYYTPAPSAALPQYQMMSAGAVTAEPPVALQQLSDAKETSPS